MKLLDTPSSPQFDIENLRVTGYGKVKLWVRDVNKDYSEFSRNEIVY
jgi:hypothetical protein